jgi:hypothetical protein
MNNQATASDVSAPVLTQHALLVAWGLYAQQIGLIEQLRQVKLKQKHHEHQPQSKVLEFLVAILAGYQHLQEISRSAHPLDQDSIVAAAWGQPGWADYSGVSRSLQRLTEPETTRVIEVLEKVSQPFLQQEVQLALQQKGYLVYDADLTGRPVSSTSTSYPDTAFGYMGDTICLGYQVAVVSFHSPSYGRLWLVNQLHPGDTVSVTQAQALVLAAEQRTGLRPLRRVNLLKQRIRQAEACCCAAEQQAASSEELLRLAQLRVQETEHALAEAQRHCRFVEADYEREQRQLTSHCKLTRARQQLLMYQQRLPRTQQALGVAQRRSTRQTALWAAAASELTQLRQHAERLQADNLTNAQPVRIHLRLDGGFASQENLAWVIEMGYDLYSKARSTHVRDTLLAAVTPASPWQRVGGNASLLAWTNTTVDGAFPYPLNVALAQYHTGETHRHAVFLHYGADDVTQHLVHWFHTYNARQTIEAGIKEGKGVFQMHHLKVRSAQALRLQEHFACFAANFVRFAAPWLIKQQVQTIGLDTTSVKQMVQVAAHTSAYVIRQGDVWLLMFTEQSLYAGSVLRLGHGPLQLPLPCFGNVYFCDF